MVSAREVSVVWRVLRFLLWWVALKDAPPMALLIAVRVRLLDYTHTHIHTHDGVTHNNTHAGMHAKLVHGRRHILELACAGFHSVCMVNLAERS